VNTPTALSVQHWQLSWLVGDIVWGRISGHPWWPCMVAYDASTSTFIRERKSMIFSVGYDGFVSLTIVYYSYYVVMFYLELE